MEVILKAGKLKRKKFKLNDHAEKILKEVSLNYNISEEELVTLALEDKKIKKDENEDIENLRREIDSLLNEMFHLEGKWASIRYKSHTYVKENRGLAIVLAGQLGENKSLRNLMKKSNAHEDIQEVVDFYLWL